MEKPYSLEFSNMDVLDTAENDGFIFNDSDPLNHDTLPSSKETPKWWKTCTVYQIWPASFKDGNNDGLGDIPGILSKLDYLQETGVDVVWLSPMYASPQIDMGYDISDYNAIYPPYGTMTDMDALITGLHSRNMKLILDLVINHTSNQHAWFQSSCSSRTNEHADWYIWKDPKYHPDPETGKLHRYPPNNWGANFGGSAWTYVPSRRQYYLHLFAPEQPDLNWECIATRSAIHESALRFWFRKGVDGFRIDTANLYSKVQGFPDGKPEKGNRLYPFAEAGPFVANGPRIHEFYGEMRREVLDGFVGGDPLMVGELGGCSEDQILEYVGSDRKELSMVFDFDFIGVGDMHRKPWHEIRGKGFDLPEMKAALGKTQDLVMHPQGWSSMFAENHDLPRSVSRFGDTGEYWEKSCKLLAMMLGTLSGTLFIYQGQEIGMTNVPETWKIADMKDLASIQYYEKVEREHPGDEEILRRAWRGIVRYGRDNARTPMQWDATEHAGFSSVDEGLSTSLPAVHPPSPVTSLPPHSGTEFAGFSTPQPWMRVNDNYPTINVASQLHSKHSVLGFWKRIIALRKGHADLFIHGSYRLHDLEDPNTFTFEKASASGKKALVMLNLSAKEQVFKMPRGFEGRDMRCLISNDDRPGRMLGAWEGRVYVEADRI